MFTLKNKKKSLPVIFHGCGFNVLLYFYVRFSAFFFFLKIAFYFVVVQNVQYVLMCERSVASACMRIGVLTILLRCRYDDN